MTVDELKLEEALCQTVAYIHDKVSQRYCNEHLTLKTDGWIVIAIVPIIVIHSNIIAGHI